MLDALQVRLGMVGVAAICIALLHIALGPASIPGSIPVNCEKIDRCELERAYAG